MLLEKSGNVVSAEEFKLRALGAAEATVRFLSAGGMVLDRIEGTIDVPADVVDGQHLEARRIKLTPLEAKILAVLMRNAPKVIHRDVLLAHAWDVKTDPGTNRVDVAINYLRQKIGKDAIETVRGLGFRIPEASA